jgi:hypothetical protein
MNYWRQRSLSRQQYALIRKESPLLGENTSRERLPGQIRLCNRDVSRPWPACRLSRILSLLIMWEDIYKNRWQYRFSTKLKSRRSFHQFPSTKHQPNISHLPLDIATRYLPITSIIMATCTREALVNSCCSKCHPNCSGCNLVECESCRM